MNEDTDTQYPFTRPVVDHMLVNYEGELRLKAKWVIKKCMIRVVGLKKGKANMAARVIQSCQDLNSAGKCLGK